MCAGETYTTVWTPECGLETIPPKPPFPPCRVVNAVDSRGMDIPRARHR